VLVLGYSPVQALDVTGPVEVFSLANRLAARGLAGRAGRRQPYRVEIVSPDGRPLETSAGYALSVHAGLARVRGPLDTLLVAGGEGSREAMEDARLRAWLRRREPGIRRVASVCSGALVLAAAGLLDGRRATTHWSLCTFMAERFPEVRVEPDPIFVRDGKFAASAGITAGMDLALALLEEDLGREPALEVARWLVLFTRRPGGQAQFSHQLAAGWAEKEPLREVQGWLADHLESDLDVTVLARRAGMSPRNFARVFTREVGMTPARYVEAARVEAARQRLERTRHGVDRIAADCGFGSAETLRRAFLRVLKVTPSEYRERFRPVAAE
jgi:transcriptional regulator GlxA family with amidase domain